MTKEELTEKQKKISSFLKLSWCIDGECTFTELVDLDVDGKTIRFGLYKLTDTVRGEFFVAVGNEKALLKK